MLKLISQILIILFLIFQNVNAAQKIKLASLEWEPYIGKKLKNNGYVAEIVKEAFAAMNYEVEIQFHTWSRTIGMAKTGPLEGYFPEYYSKELEKDFIFSNPFPGGPIGFFKKKRYPLNYKKLKDLKHHLIGVVKGYVNTAEFDSATYLKKQEALNDYVNFKNLIDGKLDLVISDKFVGLHILATKLRKKMHIIHFVEPGLEDKKLYICFSKKEKYAKLNNQVFNLGLKKIIENGTLEKIISNRGF